MDPEVSRPERVTARRVILVPLRTEYFESMTEVVLTFHTIEMSGVPDIDRIERRRSPTSDERDDDPGTTAAHEVLLRPAAGAGRFEPMSPTDLPPLSPSLEAVRSHVLEYSVKRGDFTLKSGERSSWFLDTKQTACRPEGILAVADAMLEIMPGDATAIGGLTMGADPVAFGVAAIAATRGRGLRSFSVRKEAKGHGVTGRLAGALRPGDRVVITEDTTTRGTSLMEAVDVVREYGCDVVLVSLIVDRGDTCAELCRAAGVPYRPLLTAADLGFGPND